MHSIHSLGYFIVYAALWLGHHSKLERGVNKSGNLLNDVYITNQPVEGKWIQPRKMSEALQHYTAVPQIR